MSDFESKYVRLNGLRFHYLDWGGSGRPMVLLHGLSSSAYFWSYTAPLLAKHFRVVSLDQRGHGLSAKPDLGYDFPHVVSDLDAFIDTLGFNKPVVVGHSWGGNVTVQFAVDHPERVSAIVGIDGGVVDPSSMPGATWEEISQELAPTDFASLDITFNELVQRAQDWRVSFFWGDRLEEFLKSIFTVNRNGKVRPRLSRKRHFMILRSVWDQKVSTLYPCVKVPTLFILARENSNGRDSKLASFQDQKVETARRAEKDVKECRIHWVDDSIHDVPVQRPKAMAELIVQSYKDGFFG